MPMAVAAGLSAGVCEEFARYVAMRFVVKADRRGWADALMFGAGHGGVEALLIGWVSLATLGAMLLVTLAPNSLGLDGPTLSELRSAADIFWRGAASRSIWGGVERLFALTAHIGMSVLVMRAVVERKLAFLFAAIAGHAALNAVALVAAARLGTELTEFAVGAFAVALALVTITQRHRFRP